MRMIGPTALVAALAVFGCETPGTAPSTDTPDAGPGPTTGNLGCAPSTEGARFAICAPTLTSDVGTSGPDFQVNAEVGEVSPATRITGRRFAVVGSITHE